METRATSMAPDYEMYSQVDVPEQSPAESWSSGISEEPRVRRDDARSSAMLCLLGLFAVLFLCALTGVIAYVLGQETLSQRDPRDDADIGESSGPSGSDDSGVRNPDPGLDKKSTLGTKSPIPLTTHFDHSYDDSDATGDEYSVVSSTQGTQSPILPTTHLDHSESHSDATKAKYSVGSSTQSTDKPILPTIKTSTETKTIFVSGSVTSTLTQKTSASKVTTNSTRKAASSSKPPPISTPTSTRTVDSTRLPTSKTTKTTTTKRPRIFDPCKTKDCQTQSNDLKKQLNLTADPCSDFYEFVCGNYSGGYDVDAYTKAEAAIRNAINTAINSETLPTTGQSAWQKAAGLFQSCMVFINKRDGDELYAVKSWLQALKLDPLNLVPSDEFDPVDMIVRLSLDLGVPAVYDFALSDVTFIEGKRAMQFRISDMRKEWLKNRDDSIRTSRTKNAIRYYSSRLQVYPGYDWTGHRNLGATLNKYDEALISATRKRVSGSTPFITGTVHAMGLSTQPHITSAKWADSVAKYTKGTYSGDDKILFQKELLEALVEVLANSSWGPYGMRAVLSWNVYEVLHKYSWSKRLAFGVHDRRKACFTHTTEIMDLPMTAHFVSTIVNQAAIDKAREIFAKTRAAFKVTLEASSWLRGSAREVALRKLDKMKAHIGSPGQRLDAPFVNQYYGEFPDVPPGSKFLVAWLNARSARVHQKWADQTNFLFSISKLKPYYLYEGNAVLVPAGALQPAFFLPDGNPALMYGSIGNALAHRIMNAYDVKGIQLDENGQVKHWNIGKTEEHYINQTQCMRDSHSKAKYLDRHGPLVDDTDSEDLGDLVAAQTAYRAYENLPREIKIKTLPGLNLTGEELYFVGRCMRFCKNKFDSDTADGRFASSRARCEVPSMNMDAFAEIFGCSAQKPMNPKPKCSFW